MSSPYEKFPQDLAGIQALEKELDLAIQKGEKTGETETAEQLVDQAKKKLDQIESKITPPKIKTKFINPENQGEQAIEIDLEKALSEQVAFYKNRLNLEIDEAEVKSIWNKNYAEIKSEIEKYGYDEILIVPDNLPEEAILNQSLIETMEENIGNKKKKVAATFQGGNFESGGSFAGVKNSYSPKYRLVLTHSVQNIEDHSILKATRNKNIMQVTGLDKTEVNRRITNGGELSVDCKIEVGGQEIEIKAEGISLEEYILQQRMHFDKSGEHLDVKSKSYVWLLKSRSGSRVAGSNWHPVGRQLDVRAYVPGSADDDLGLRLSRSFKS